MKTWGRGGIVPPFLSSALGGGEWSALLPGHVIPKEIASGTHCIGDCVGHRTGLDAVEKRRTLTLTGIEPLSSSL